MKRKARPWYRKAGLKHLTGFLTPEEKALMQALATAADKSLTSYVTNLLKQHLYTAAMVHRHCPLLKGKKTPDETQ